MSLALQLGDIAVDIVFKDIKNLHLSVYPPTGRVRVSAPLRTNIDTIRAFLISKLGWIRQNQCKLELQERETPREYLDRESHYLWGKRMLLEIIPTEVKPYIKINHNKICIGVIPAYSYNDISDLIDELYRRELKNLAYVLSKKWQTILGIEIKNIFIQRMKTKWGSCNPKKGNIRLNLDLAKKPDVCVEYIFLHEAVHFLEPTHGARFVALMDKYMSNWRLIRQQLNDEPLSHTDWKY